MDHDEVLAANRRLWDAWTPIHERSAFYDVEAFRRGETSLRSIELRELGDAVQGKSLLHLQCHFGLDTLSWARMGARVTGIDLSPKAIETARGLTTDLGLSAHFVACDVMRLRQEIRETFEIVYTSYGVLDWLEDLDRWGQVVAESLRPGGTFYMVEFHPVTGMLAADGRTIEHGYFRQEKPLAIAEKGTYADPEAAVEGTSYVWSHGLAEVVGALVGAGLRIDHLHEFDESPYDCFPFTREVAPGRATVPGMEGKIPLVYSLRASKPGP